jgi:hypothetical protein
MEADNQSCNINNVEAHSQPGTSSEQLLHSCYTDAQAQLKLRRLICDAFTFCALLLPLFNLRTKNVHFFKHGYPRNNWQIFLQNVYESKTIL